MISNRIDSLSPSAQLVLKVASVIGRTFSYELLYDIFPVEQTKGTKEMGTLKQYLATLTIAGLIVKLRLYNVYSFKHSTILECCYNLLLPSQRQHLHKSIAEWYEHNHKSFASNFHVLAHHWLSANEPSKALQYLELSGERALAMFANLEAVDFFSRVVRIANELKKEFDLAQKAHWQRCLGEALYNLGRFDVGFSTRRWSVGVGVLCTCVYA